MKTRSFTFKLKSDGYIWSTTTIVRDTGAFARICDNGLRDMFDIPLSVSKIIVVFSREPLCKDSVAFSTDLYGIFTGRNYKLMYDGAVKTASYMYNLGYRYITVYYA